MNKDNQIMSLLSDIDEELIDDVLEIPQSPETGIKAIKASNKSIFAKFALPAAACLVVAAVSVGVLVISGKNPSGEEQTSQPSCDTAAPSTPVFTEVSDEVRAECESLIAEELDPFQRRGCTYSCCGIDLNFDGVDEIVIYPAESLGSTFLLEKTEEGYKRAGSIDIEGLYALNRLENLRLYDKYGERYFYYYYFNEPQDYYEEKGIAKLQLDENGVTSESLLSYGAYLNEHPEDANINLLTHYYKIGERNASYDELSALWSEYEGVPPIEIEEYWHNGTVSLENAPLLSDLIKENVLPNIDGSFVTGGIRDSYNFNYEGTVPKVILSQKDCGENKISLLGYKVRTDNAYDDSRIIIHRLMLVLSDKNGNLLSVQKVTEPTNRIYEDCDFPLNYTDDSLEAVDFGENQVIIYRCIFEDEIFQHLNLFAVKENSILPCLFFDPDDEYSQSYTPYLSPLYTVDNDPDCPSLTDQILNKKLQFNFLESEKSVSYTIETVYSAAQDGGDTLDLSEYPPVETVEIPVIPESGDYLEKARYALDNAVPKVLFAQKTFTGGGSVYTLNLIAEKVWAGYSERILSDLIYSAALRTAVFKDGQYLGSIVRCEGTSFMSMKADDYEEYLPEGYYCGEYHALMLIKHNPAFDYSYGRDCFAAVYSDTLYRNLYGNWDEALKNKPDWSYTAEDQSLYSGSIEVRENTITCGYFVYRFNFGDDFEHGMRQYEVFWREEKPRR